MRGALVLVPAEDPHRACPARERPCRSYPSTAGHGLVAEWARRGPKTAARGGWSRHAVPWAKRPARSRVVSSVSPFGVERERVRRDEYWSLSWGDGFGKCQSSRSPARRPAPGARWCFGWGGRRTDSVLPSQGFDVFSPRVIRCMHCIVVAGHMEYRSQ